PFCYVAHDSLYTLSVLPLPSSFLSNHPSTTDIYTLSLHDALPISDVDGPHAADESGGRVGERRGRVEDGPRVLADVRREHGVDLHRHRLAPHRHRAQLPRRDHALDVLVRGLADDDRGAVVLRDGLETRGEVDGVADRGVLEALPRAEYADDRLTRVDPDAVPDRDAELR